MRCWATLRVTEVPVARLWMVTRCSQARRADLRHAEGRPEQRGLPVPQVIRAIGAARGSPPASTTPYGERAVDTFYVTDLTGDRIMNAGRLKTLEKRLLAAAAGEELDLAA